MAQGLLVSVDIPQGAKVLKALDDAGIGPKVCAWLYLSEYEDWRLVIASPKLDAVDLGEAYGLIHKATDAAGMTPRTEPSMLPYSMSDSLIRELRKRYAKSGDVEGMRIGGQQFGRRFVEDGYVYRIR